MTGYSARFTAAVDAAVDGATVLAANQRSARALRSAAEEQLRQTRAAWPTPQMLPFGAFVEQLYRQALAAGAVHTMQLQREQELQLWSQIILRSPAGGDVLLPDSAAALAAQSFRTAMDYGIALDSAQMSASSDSRAFAGWAAEFRRQLAAKHWSVPALLTRDLAGCLRELQLPPRIFVFLSETVPAERAFLAKLVEAGVIIEEPPLLDVDAERNAVRIEFDDVDDELRAAAAWARQRVEADATARTGVIFFDLAERRAPVESAFRAALNPEQLFGDDGPAAFEIATAPMLDEYAAVRCALRLLDFAATEVEFHDFDAVLTSPYLLAAQPEAAAKFIARLRPHARRRISRAQLAESLRERGDLPVLLAALERLPNPAELAAKHNAAHWAEFARNILRGFGWPQGVALSSEEFQSVECWQEVITSVASLDLLDWHGDFAAFVRKLARAAASRRFKPESHGAPVQIMDAIEADGSVFDALWIGSCCDRFWPRLPTAPALIPAALLAEAGFALTGRAEAERASASATARLQQSAPNVVLSLARFDARESEQRWSPCFAELPLSEEEIAPTPSILTRFAPVQMEELIDRNAPPLGPGEAAHGGTWLLQDQSHCPFRAFAIRRLHAKQLQGPHEAMAPFERGNLVERALQFVWDELQESDGLLRADRDAVVAAAVVKAMAEELSATDDPWTLRFRRLEYDRTIAVVNEWLTLEAGRAPFHVIAHQGEVELSLGGLKIKGKIDRLDEVADKHLILDYKTGAEKSVAGWRVPRPLEPQLPFYALAVKQQGLDVAGISFASVRRGACKFKGYTRSKDLLNCTQPRGGTFDELSFDDYTARWAEGLEHIAQDFVRGEAAVDPKIPPGQSNSPCAHCHLTELCRIGELADDDAEEAADE